MVGSGSDPDDEDERVCVLIKGQSRYESYHERFPVLWFKLSRAQLVTLNFPTARKVLHTAAIVGCLFSAPCAQAIAASTGVPAHHIWWTIFMVGVIHLTGQGRHLWVGPAACGLFLVFTFGRAWPQPSTVVERFGAAEYAVLTGTHTGLPDLPTMILLLSVAGGANVALRLALWAARRTASSMEARCLDTAGLAYRLHQVAEGTLQCPPQSNGRRMAPTTNQRELDSIADCVQTFTPMRSHHHVWAMRRNRRRAVRFLRTEARTHDGPDHHCCLDFGVSNLCSKTFSISSQRWPAPPRTALSRRVVAISAVLPLLVAVSLLVAGESGPIQTSSAVALIVVAVLVIVTGYVDTWPARLRLLRHAFGLLSRLIAHIGLLGKHPGDAASTDREESTDEEETPGSGS